MRTIVAVIYTFCLVMAALAADVPALTGRINDNAHLLSQSQLTALTKQSESIEQENQSKPQVVVLTVVALPESGVDVFTHDVFESWKLGQVKTDNGILIVIAPKERKIRIEVGYGLEGAIPDSRAISIIDHDMKPHLARGHEDYYAALSSAISSISTALSEPKKEEAASSSDSSIPFVIIIVAGVLAIALVIFIIQHGANTMTHETPEAARKRRAKEDEDRRRKKRSEESSYSSSFGSSPSSSPSSSFGSDIGSFSGGGGSSGGGGASSDF